MERYIVLDSTGNKVGIPFKEWKEASIYKTIYGRQDWKITKVKITESNRRSTERQIAAVHFCESWLNVEFTGDITNFYEVSEFLSEYLEEAKMLYTEIKSEYEAYLFEKL